MFPWLTALIAWPLVAALATLLAGRRRLPGSAAGARIVALAGALVQVGLLVGAFVAFDASAAGEIQLVEQHEWIPALGASYAVGVSGVGLLLIALSVVLVPLVLLAEWRTQRTQHSDEQSRAYAATVLVLASFMVAVFAARDLFLFYVVFEAMLIPACLLIGAFGAGVARRRAAIKFLIFSLTGGLVMLVGVIALYFQLPEGARGADAFLLSSLAEAAPSLGQTPGRLIFLAFFIAFAIKAPLFPVHTWLPDAVENATPGTSTLLVGVMDKAGTFGMLAICLPLFPEAARWAAPVVVWLAVASILYGAILAIGQSDVLRLIGYTSISHFGFMVLGIFTFTEVGTAGASLMMVGHGLSVGAMFLVAGFAIARHPSRSRAIAGYGGLRQVAPVLGGVFLVAALSAASLPGLATFVPELLVLIGAFGANSAAVVVAVPAVVLAAVYALWTYQRMFLGEPSAEVAGIVGLPEGAGVAGAGAAAHVASAQSGDLDGRERAVASALIGLLLLLGVAPALGLRYVNGPAAAISSLMEVEP